MKLYDLMNSHWCFGEILYQGTENHCCLLDPKPKNEPNHCNTLSNQARVT